MMMCRCNIFHGVGQLKLLQTTELWFCRMKNIFGYRIPRQRPVIGSEDFCFAVESLIFKSAKFEGKNVVYGSPLLALGHSKHV